MKWPRLLSTVLIAVVPLVAVEPALAQGTKSTAHVASPELVGLLTKECAVTPAQAKGGAGALFSLAKSRLSADDFSKVAAVVPGMKNFLKAAPSTGDSSALSALEGEMPGGLGGLASTAGAFEKLGLSPKMATKFLPVMVKFVENKGGSATGSLLSGVLK